MSDVASPPIPADRPAPRFPRTRAPRMPAIPAAPGALETAHGLSELLGKVVRTALTRPYSWVPGAVDEAARTLRLCLAPLLLSMVFFSIGLLVTLVGGALQAIGSIDRLGGGFAAATVREVAFWITSMIFAGVVGSALTADLGARKIREELDALAVLGVDQIRTLVVPRVVALTVMAPVLGLIALGAAFVTVSVLAPVLLPNVTTADVVESGKVFMTVGDLISLVLKLLICGVLVGVVCCYKGLTSSGGTAGVGRAVNQAVLINFMALWALNSLWNAAFLAAFPGVQQLRG